MRNCSINTHLYFGSPQQIADVLGPYRQWVGPARKIYVTETNCPAPLAAFGQAAAGFVTALRAANAVPMVYRLLPRGDSAWDDRCLFDRAAAQNTPVVSAWLD